MNKKNIFKFTSLIVITTTTLTFIGCGKHEAEGGTIGTALGAVAGAALSNRHHQAEGAIVGGVIGHAFGRLAGAKDDKEESDAKNQHQIASLKQENHELQKSLEKWCPSCRKKYSMRGANSCPQCGCNLITEKLCRNCKALFSPESGYNYCPYCKEGILLSCR